MADVIEEARETLKRWRTDTPDTKPWKIGPRMKSYGLTPVLLPNGVSLFEDPDSGMGGATREDRDARLIVGTAGNPALLDILDRFLADCLVLPVEFSGYYAMRGLAEGIATEIVRADNEMNNAPWKDQWRG